VALLELAVLAVWREITIEALVEPVDLAVQLETVVTVVTAFSVPAVTAVAAEMQMAVAAEMQMTVTVTLDKVNATIELSLNKSRRLLQPKSMNPERETVLFFFL
jgi:hypothetical protein